MYILIRFLIAKNYLFQFQIKILFFILHIFKFSFYFLFFIFYMISNFCLINNIKLFLTYLMHYKILILLWLFYYNLIYCIFIQIIRIEILIKIIKMIKIFFISMNFLKERKHKYLFIFVWFSIIYISWCTKIEKCWRVKAKSSWHSTLSFH